MGYFALEAPPWQEAGEVTGRVLGSRQFHLVSFWPETASRRAKVTKSVAS